MYMNGMPYVLLCHAGEQCLPSYFPFTVHTFVYILCTCSFVEGFYYM